MQGKQMDVAPPLTRRGSSIAERQAAEGSVATLSRELAALAVDGAVRSAFIVGPEGMGKSHSLGDLASRLAELGISTVEVPAYGGQLRLFAATLLAERLGEIAPGLFTDPGQAAVRVRQALTSARHRGKRYALLFDDVHLLHEDDIAVIRSLVFEPPRPDLFVALGMEEGSSLAADQLRAALADSAFKSTEVVLRPLSQRGVRDIAQRIVGESGSAFVARLHEMCGGIPFYAVALLEDLARRPVDERRQVLLGVRDIGSLGVPPNLAAAIRRRLTSFPEAAVELLEALAAWNGGPLSIEDLTAINSIPEDDIRVTIDYLTKSQVVSVLSDRSHIQDRFAISERIITTVVRESTPIPRRSELHRAAAGILESKGSEALDEEGLVALVRHYVDGLLPLTPGRVRHVLAASRFLNSTSRYEEVRDLLQACFRKFQPDVSIQQVAESQELLAQALSHLDAVGDAEQLLTGYRHASSEMIDSDTWARVLSRLGRIQVVAGKHAEASDTYRMVVENTSVAPAIRDQALSDLSAVYERRGLVADALTIACKAVAEADGRGDREMAAYARTEMAGLLIKRGQSTLALEELRRALRDASAAGNYRLSARAIGRVGITLMDLESLSRGTRFLKRGLRLSHALGDLASASTGCISLAKAQLEAGDWSDAIKTARRGAEIDRELRRRQSLSVSTAVAALIDSCRGEWSAAAFPSAGVALEELELRVALPMVSALFEREIAQGHPESALRLVQRMDVALDVESGWRLWYREVPFRTAIALFELRDADGLAATRERVRRFELMTAGTQPVLHADGLLLEGLSLVVRQEFEAGAEKLASGVAGLDEAGYVWRAALMKRYLGLAYWGAGQSALAADALKRSFASLSHMGASAARERVRADLRLMNRRVPRTTKTPMKEATNSSVTAREWDVIRLVVQGKTDTEIASALWLSRRTVTTHIHNILKKTALRSRVELAAWLRREESARESP